MPEPLRPLPPRTVLVSNPDARKDVANDDDEREEAEAAERRQNESPAGFLKNAIDRSRTERKLNS